MRKLLVLIFMFSFQMANAVDIRTLFAEMPDSVLPLLSRINRLDMLDFAEGGMKSVVRNKLDGESELLRIDRTSLSIRYTDKSEIDMRLFFFKDSVPVICVSHTVFSVLADSRIDFYDSHWNRIDGDRLLTLPDLKDFVIKGIPRDSLSVLYNASEVRSIRVRIPDDSDCLEFEYTGLSFLGSDSVRYAGFLRESPLRYNWNGRRFVP